MSKGPKTRREVEPGLVPKIKGQTTELAEVLIPNKKPSQHPGRHLPTATRKPKKGLPFVGKLKEYWAWPIYFLNGKTVLIPNRSLKIMDDLLETKDENRVMEKHGLTAEDLATLFNDKTFSAVLKDKMVRVNIKAGLSEEWFLEQMYNIYANEEGIWSPRESLEALKEIGTRKAPRQQAAVNIEKPIINITMGALEASKERQEVIEAKLVNSRETEKRSKD